jgi:serine/threonine-protein kinase
LRLGVSLDLGEELGRGGMGTVHTALDRWLGRRVAVKLLAPSPDREIVDRRFILEAQLGAQLEHPNIVPFYELLVAEDGAPALVMRLVRGQTMAAYLATAASSMQMSHTAPYDLPSRLERFLKVCDAVAYAHARAVVHRDLKPENVMLGTHNEVYVMDWGVARVMADEKEDRVSSGAFATVGSTRTGEIIGTPGYMSPEQAAAESITYAADQYALGMMLAEIATLCAPRPGAELEQLSAAMLATDPRLAHRFDEEVPEPLAAIVRKATARRPDHRYPDVEAFAADVRRFMRDEPISIVREARWHRAWRWTKHRPVLVLGAFTVLVSLVAGLAVLVLVGRLEARTRAERRSERLSEITAAIGRRARRIDAQFQRVALLVEGLADAADQVLRYQPAGETHVFTPRDLAVLETTKIVERYGQRVSFVHAATVASPDIAETARLPLERRAAELQALLEDAAARASGRGASLTWTPEERQRIALAGSPLQWTDLAFEEGVLFVYPGNTFFPADYDVRQRPWYLDAKRQAYLLWSSPYPDATSGRLLLPCVRAFFTRSGELRGVAAAHLALDAVLDSLEFHDVAGFRSAVLLDERGDVVLSTLARGIDYGRGTHENRAIERRPFHVVAVREAIASKRRDGRVFDAEGLYVFQRLEGNDWSLVASLDSTIVD